MATLVYCKVVGTFRGFVADTIDDTDDLPEFSIPTGSGVITPNVKMVRLNDATEPKIFYPSPTQVTIDADGRLSQGGRPYVNLLAPTADMIPNSFSYSIIMTLRLDNSSRVETWGPYYLTPEAGTTKNLFDITSTSNTTSPTPTGDGTTYVEDPNNEGFFIEA